MVKVCCEENSRLWCPFVGAYEYRLYGMSSGSDVSVEPSAGSFLGKRPQSLEKEQHHRLRPLAKKRMTMTVMLSEEPKWIASSARRAAYR